jgi:metal-dependent amidase/aminoacylase/carboxypeptidase family protein
VQQSLKEIRSVDRGATMSREYLENADRGDYNSSNMAELLGIRKYLHQHPELAFKEYDTSAYLRQQLDDHGIAVRRYEP